MDLDRAKERRKYLRISFTKHITKIENTLGTQITEINTKESKVNELLSLRAQLEDKINELIKLDNEIQSTIELNEMEAEIESCEDYKDKGTQAKCKINVYVESINDSKDNVGQFNLSIPNAGNSMTFQSPKISVKLPKLNINTFYGDYSKFMDF